MFKYLSVFVLYVITLSFTSCDEHRDFPDTAVKASHILCTDGKLVSYEDFDASGKEAIAVVFYINQSEVGEGTGYAVYLWDIEAEALSDSLGVSQGTSADISAHDGNTNTFALYNCSDVNSPVAQRLFAIWHYGQSAYLPSVAQIQLLYAAKSMVNPIIDKLGGDPLPDNPDDCWYWTSTEVSGQETAKAWLYSIGSGAMQETPKIQPHKARPIITLYN